MKKYFIYTMGCQMNERDSETVAGLLEQEGYAQAESAEDAQVLVVNTCSVRENADNRFFGLLGRLKAFKDKNPETLVAVCGCMPQQEHIRRRIADKHAWVDIVFGTHNIHELPELLRKRAQEHSEVARVMEQREALVEGLPAKRASDFKAYVNVLYGCNNFCSYCIVPYTRGREISRAPAAVLDEIRGLAAVGVREITLLGQNVNSYSADGVNFAELLREADKIGGIERIRFMTSHPKDLTDELISLFARGADGEPIGTGLRHLCPSIHLPVQSGSSRILEKMNRKYTKEEYLLLLEKLRAQNPEIVVTTDFIVGFPGETDEDFAETLDLIRRARFDAAFTFLYSPREGTPAAKEKEQVESEVAHVRFDEMVALLNEISLEKNERRIGSIEEVLIEGAAKTGENMLSGRTFGGRLVNFPSAPSLRPGQFITLRITGANTFSFIGEVI